MSVKLGIKRGPYKPKSLQFVHTCEMCSQSFASADVKGRFCSKCKEPRSCSCGCGKIVKTPGRLYYSGCKLRGKTYKEIYGNKETNSGFKTGLDNPMADKKLLEKALNNVTKHRVLYDGIAFRSTWEVEVYKDIKKFHDDIKYEPSIKYSGGWFKPDFMIGDLIIEVSGYASAFEKSRERNIDKLKKYLEYTDKFIIFIISRKHIDYYTTIFKQEKRIKFYEYEQKNTIHF